MALNEADVAVPECVRNALTSIARARGWENPQYHIEKGSNEGDGFLSDLFRVVIQHENETIPLMCKATMASMGKSVMVESAFKAEIFVFDEVLPVLEKIAHLKDPLPWPRGYYTNPQPPCLVMEDLRPQGFAMHEKSAVFDEKRCRLVVSQLAKFHGAGMALDKLRPDLMSKLRRIGEDPAWRAELRKMYEPFLKAPVNAADMVTDRFPEGSPVNKKLKKMLASFPEEFYEYCLPDPEGGNTIVHGDCHINNILFQLDEIGSAVGCRLIDFQTVRYAWPVPDLTHVLLLLTEKTLRDEHWDDLMRAYHEELTSTLKAAGIEDTDSVYSWNRFQQQLERACRMSLCDVPATVYWLNDESAIQEVQDSLSQFSEADKRQGGGDFTIKWSPEVKRRFGDAVQSLVEWGWL